MNKKIIIIGNTARLCGVEVDMNGFKEFFLSDCGGCWDDEEIVLYKNKNGVEILEMRDYYRRQNLDYAITIFTGHGAYDRNSTILELQDNDMINEDDLDLRAKKQLFIFDCCRAHLNVGITASAKSFSMIKNAQYPSSYEIREAYEERISRAFPQKVRLYACSIGESAYDSGNGAFYSQSLLEFSDKLALYDERKFVLVAEAHSFAESKTYREVQRQHGDRQTPEIECEESIPPQNQLIIAVNPNIRCSQSSFLSSLRRSKIKR